MTPTREHQDSDPPTRRPRVVRTAVVLAIVAGLIYAGFIARGVLGI